MKKKWQVSLIVAIMIALVLTGCGKTETPSKDQTATKAPSSTSSSNSNEGSESTGKIAKEPITYQFSMGEHPNQPIVADAPSFQLREEITGIKLKIEAVPSDNYEEKLQTLIATNNLPDIFYIEYPMLQSLATTGVFLPISDYLDYAPNFKKLMEEIPDIHGLQVDGKLYGFPKLGKNVDFSGPLPMIRKDILDDLNLQTPTTFDELFDVLMKMKEAYPDSVPMATRWGTEHLLTVMSYPLGSGFDIYYDFDVNDGEWLYGPSHPEFKHVVTYLNRLYTNDLMDPDYAVATADSWREKLSSGKSLFYYDNDGFAGSFTAALKSDKPDALFDLIPNMKNAIEQRRNYVYPMHEMEETFALSAKIENPELAVQYMDWMYSEEGYDVTNFARLGEDYTKDNGNYTYSDSIIEKYKDESNAYKLQTDLGTGFLSFNLYVDGGTTITNNPYSSEVGAKRNELLANQQNSIKNGIVSPPVEPPLTKEESEKVRRLRTDLNSIVYQEVDKFIMGTKPLEEFDAFIEKLQQAGASELEQIFNSAQSRIN